MPVEKIVEHAIKIGGKLVPPADTPGEKLLLWRVTLVLFNGFIAIVMTIHIAWACGFLPGFSGFALADDIQEMRHEARDLKRVILEKEIFETRNKHCTADAVQKPFYYARLVDLVRQYRQLVGEAYSIPSCEELGL